MGPRHPWWVAICETVATFEACCGVQHSDVLRKIKWDLAIPSGQRSAKLSPLPRPAGGSSTVTSDAESNGTSPSLVGSD
eukprot:6028965-Pyramimonas_sp.AAC.1